MKKKIWTAKFKYKESQLQELCWFTIPESENVQLDSPTLLFFTC